MNHDPVPAPGDRSQFLFCQMEDGTSNTGIWLEEGTVWLPQAMIANHFQTTKQNVSLHFPTYLQGRKTCSGCNSQGIPDNSDRRITENPERVRVF